MCRPQNLSKYEMAMTRFLQQEVLELMEEFGITKANQESIQNFLYDRSDQKVDDQFLALCFGQPYFVGLSHHQMKQLKKAFHRLKAWRDYETAHGIWDHYQVKLARTRIIIVVVLLIAGTLLGMYYPHPNYDLLKCQPNTPAAITPLSSAP